MNYEILPDDRLRIYLKEGDLEVLEQFAKDQGESFSSDNDMGEVFEHLLCNSELEWSSPERIAALTAAPILCISRGGEPEPIDHYDQEGYMPAGGEPDSQGVYRIWGYKILQAWAFMDYAVRSPQRDLLFYGECFWQCGWKIED